MSPTYALYVASYGSLTPGTATPTGTRTTATVNPGSLAVGCNNLFFIRDVTIPAGTVMQRNQDFTKTWKVQNNGTCDWLYQYILVPLSGDRMSGDGTKLQKLVKVNNWTELSVSLTAPNKPGTYTGYWRLSNGQGTFGATLMVSIIVSDPATSTSVPPATNTQSPQLTSTSTSAPLPTDTPLDTLTPEPTSTP
jgi:next-to-BRCA1 protein 1